LQFQDARETFDVGMDGADVSNHPVVTGHLTLAIDLAENPPGYWMRHGDGADQARYHVFPIVIAGEVSGLVEQDTLELGGSELVGETNRQDDGRVKEADRDGRRQVERK
jgi:hypothetical protein